VTFNINNQNAGLINNVAGDQHIHGGQAGSQVTLDAARGAVRQLRQVLSGEPLPQAAAAAALGDLDDLDVEMCTQEPDRPTIADRLRHLTSVLISAGSLASAGAAVIGPLQTLVTWLGHLGEPIGHMLATMSF